MGIFPEEWTPNICETKSILGDVPAFRVGLTVSKTSPRMMSDEASLGKLEYFTTLETLKLQKKYCK